MISERSKLRTPLQLDLSVTYKELRCRYTHDVAHYLAEKPEDIIFPQTVDALVDSILEPVMGASNTETNLPSSINPNTICPVFQERGECRVGFKCRFLGGHIKKEEDGSFRLVKDEEKFAQRKDKTLERNFLPNESLKQLRTKKVRFAVSPGLNSSLTIHTRSSIPSRSRMLT